MSAATNSVEDGGIAERQPLAGRRIVVPESRQLDLFWKMMDQQGPASSDAHWLRSGPSKKRLNLTTGSGAWVGGLHDLLLFHTGDGVSHIVARGEQRGLRSAALAAFAGAQKAVGGPKRVVPLRKLGNRTNAAGRESTTAGLLALLAELPLQGRCAGVQIYPNGLSDRL